MMVPLVLLTPSPCPRRSDMVEEAFLSFFLPQLLGLSLPMKLTSRAAPPNSSPRTCSCTPRRRVPTLAQAAAAGGAGGAGAGPLPPPMTA